jgi:NTP pyrophosphatase (non-canonical NTP hydrolase)
MPVIARGLKLGEEFGEFSEALLHSQGLLPHKEMKEPLVGEAADVIICTLDALAGAHPDWAPEYLIDRLNEQLDKKSDKWLRVMRALANETRT